MTQELKKFIQNNKILINQNTKESWEEIYDKIGYTIMGDFTKILLDSGINDPASIMGYIPRYYFSGTDIKNYIVPSNVTHISNDAFSGCSSLRSVVISNSVTTIGDWAFNNCSSLTSVIIPNSVTSIGGFTFRDCRSLKEIIFKGTKEQAINCGIGNKWVKTWRKSSAIEKIVCSDGVIEL